MAEHRPTEWRVDWIPAPTQQHPRGCAARSKINGSCCYYVAEVIKVGFTAGEMHWWYLGAWSGDPSDEVKATCMLLFPDLF